MFLRLFWCFSGTRVGALLMVLWNFVDYFLRIFRVLEDFDDFGGSDPDFDTVLTRSPSVFGIFAIQN